MQRATRLTIAAVLACLQWGCSTQAWYEAARLTAEGECARQAPGAYEKCRARVNQQRYDDYDKARTGMQK